MLIKLKWLLSIVLIVATNVSVADAGPTNVLVVMNATSPDSVTVARYYMARRGIAAKYLCKVYCPTEEQIKDDVFEETIRTPIKRYLTSKGLKDKIDYIVLTKGIPIRTAQHWGIDNALTCMFNEHDVQMENPYFNEKRHFSHSEYGYVPGHEAGRADCRGRKGPGGPRAEGQAREGPFPIGCQSQLGRLAGL